MHLSYAVAPSEILWAGDLYRYIQEFKAGTFDSSEVYSQFAWLIVPEVTATGAGGPFSAYFAIKAPDEHNEFSIFSPITDVSVWFVQDGAPVYNMLYADGLSLAFAAVLAANSALALEKLIFSGDDYISFVPATPDGSDDVLHGWAGADDIEVSGSGGTDRFHGDAGNDRISIFDGVAGTLHGVAGSFFGYGGAGADTVQGDDRGDHIYGGTGNDSLLGFEGNDTMLGGAGRDLLQGGAGRDSLAGGDGADVIFGSLGVDREAGGAGADLFVFTWGGAVDHYDSGVPAAGRDVVTDFTRGADLIRLVESSLAAIVLIGHGGFTGSNQVRWVSAGGNTTIFINGDDDLAADMAITLLGVTGLQAADFQLA
jgi:Ca2+-binding RTX toxin-like protein